MGGGQLLARVKVGRTGTLEFVALVVFALFMASMNAFEGRRGWVSYAYWLAVMLGGGVVAALVEVLLWRIRALAARPWLLAVAQIFAMTPPVGAVVWLVASVTYRLPPRFEDYLGVLPSVFIVDIAVVLIAVLIRRGSASLSPPVAREGVAPEPLRAKLPPRLARARLIAVEAEDHYLRLHTDAGDALVLMRFADALAALKDTPGLQTHRSWWVARDAVEHVSFRRGRGELLLRGGLKAPVSRGFAPAVKATDWAEV